MGKKGKIPKGLAKYLAKKKGGMSIPYVGGRKKRSKGGSMYVGGLTRNGKKPTRPGLLGSMEGGRRRKIKGRGILSNLLSTFGL